MTILVPSHLFGLRIHLRTQGWARRGVVYLRNLRFIKYTQEDQS